MTLQLLLIKGRNGDDAETSAWECFDRRLAHEKMTVLGKHPRIKDPVSCRTMEVYTTEPGLQMYTGNFLAGIKGQHGATFPRRSAVCFEAQKFPDTPNHPYFPSCRLNPGETYTQKTIYKFGVEK